MSYLNQFISAWKFGHTFNSQVRPTHDQVTTLRAQVTAVLETEYKQWLHAQATGFAEGIPPRHVINRCHAISQSFFENYGRHGAATSYPIFVTVGNVFYQGLDIYGLSKNELRAIISQGPTTRETLGVHVWLTLSDSTVMDLTLIPTLRARGILPAGTRELGSVLMWNEANPGPFRFRPLLVDNQFLYRVDSIRPPDE